MGRKKNAPAEAKTEAPAEAPNLTQAILHALNTLGVDAETAAVKNHIKNHFPGVDVERTSFQSTLSLKRKAMREGGNGRAAKKAEDAPAARPAAATPEPTLTDLLRIKEAADAQGGAGELLKVVDSLRGVADSVGGLDKLARGLEALQRLTGK